MTPTPFILGTAFLVVYTWLVCTFVPALPPILPSPTYLTPDYHTPSVGKRYYHLHPPPTVPVWSWSNRLSDVYDDYFRITLHCDPHGSCHVEVESFRIE